MIFVRWHSPSQALIAKHVLPTADRNSMQTRFIGSNMDILVKREVANRMLSPSQMESTPVGP